MCDLKCENCVCGLNICQRCEVMECVCEYCDCKDEEECLNDCECFCCIL